VNERGTELMRKASRQLDEIAEFFGTLNDADLRKPCPGDSGGDTVGAVAAHMAQGYHFLGKFLQAGGYVPGSAATGNRKGRGHCYRKGHGCTFAPAALPDVVDRLTGGKAPIGLLADLTDEQLDSVPPAGSSRFSNGSRTLEQVIDEVIAHQAAHLMRLKGAVITRDRKDTRMAGSPPYPHLHHCSTAPRGPEDLYTSPPPWDIGRPQPAFLALADAGAIRGRVLDVGCGTGEHVLMCAGLGLDATGVDLASAALHAAKEKARDRGRTVRFLLQDALYLADLGESFDTVLDCGLFHIFNDEDRAAFVDSLRYVLTPGGRYFMLCFSDQQPGDWGPHRVTRDEITASFTDEWRIDSIEPSTIDITTDPAGIRAWLVALTRIPTSANP
jgi:ubiquinone/menaquinone biosynthesis C-methylase UbiE